jgi:hypothetical protein
MTSRRKAKANRRNALVSTGPRSVEGKLVASKNATRHGLLSHLEVLPHLETAQEWRSHCGRIMKALQPIGYLELALAERIALNFWRLRRVARFERDDAAIAIERFARPPASASSMARHYEERADFARRLLGIPDDEKTDKGLAAALIAKVADAAGGVDLWGDKGTVPLIDLPGAISLGSVGWQQTRDLHEINWDGRLLRKVLTAVAERTGRKLGDLLAQVEQDARAKADAERKELARVGDRLMRLNALPNLDKLEKLNRYETSIERSLQRNLHELQRLQAARAGETVPPPAVVDMTLNVGLPAHPGPYPVGLSGDEPPRLPINGFVSQKKEKHNERKKTDVRP